MATIKDVAKKAGVTPTTVSRVLNNRGYISEKTRQAVYQAMEELNYQPNEIARSLSKSDTNCIGIVLPSIRHPFFSSVLSCLEYHASLLGYKIMVCNSQENREKEREYLGMLDSNRVSGIVFCARSGGIERKLGTVTPIVAFEREVSDDVPAVLCDNYQGGVLATKCLLDAGCRHLIALGGGGELGLPADTRCVAFTQTCREYGREGQVFCASEAQFYRQQYEPWLEQIMRAHKEVDGVFATSDVVAAQLIRVCRRMGLRVPEDVSIVGFDDTSIAQLTFPAITSIHQPIEQMCDYAIDAIIRKIGGEMIPSRIVFPVSLMERESVRGSHQSPQPLLQ